jgi:hypothetical protein
MELHNHAAALSGTAETRLMGHTNCAVTAICALVVAIGSRMDTTALTSRLGVAASEMAVSSLSGAHAADAHKWIKENWKLICGLPSNNYPLPDSSIPGPDDVEKLTEALRLVVREQTGLNWKLPRGNGAKGQVTQFAMWSTLGIDAYEYLTWYASPHAKQFGMIPVSNQCCTECNGVGDDVDCVQQRGMWRCKNRQSLDSWAHRQPYEPLDMKAAWVATPAAATEEHKDHGIVIDATGQLETVVNRLLRDHLGFPDGIMTNKPGVLLEDMQTAWSNANLTPADQADILLLCRVNLTAVIAHRTQMRTLRKRVGSILGVVGLKLESERPWRGGLKKTLLFVRML